MVPARSRMSGIMHGMRRIKTDNGFTLIELATVLVVLGGLAAIALPRFINLRDEAYTQRAETAASSFEQTMNNGRMGWAANGKGSNVTMSGTTVPVTADGWPRPANSTDQACADLWNDTLTRTEPAVPGTRTSGAPGWSAQIIFSDICYYQMQADTDPVHRVIYFPTDFFGFYEAGTVLQF